jgi:group I intron endonuclease
MIDTACIYAIINKVSNDFYIGSAVNLNSRIWKHKNLLRANKHHSRILQNSWNKHGEENFEFSIIEELPLAKTRFELTIPEQKWIDFFKPRYNLSPTANSMLGFKHSEESKRKRSERTKGVPKPWLLGKKMSKDVVEANRQRQIGKKYSKETNLKKGLKKEKHNMWRKSHTDESRIKMRLGQAIWQASKPHKRIYQFDKKTHKLINSFKNIWELESLTGIKRKRIFSVIGYNKSASGFHWSYKACLFISDIIP